MSVKHHVRLAHVVHVWYSIGMIYASIMHVGMLRSLWPKFHSLRNEMMHDAQHTWYA